MEDINKYFTTYSAVENPNTKDYEFHLINPEDDSYLYKSVATTETEPSSTTTSSTSWFKNYPKFELAQTSSAVSSSLNNTSLEKSISKYLNIPYVYGGNSSKGIDCSGFTSSIFKDLGYDIGRTSINQYKNTSHVKKDEVKPGDLYFLQGTQSGRGSGVASHVGIIVDTSDIANGKIKVAEASHKGTISTDSKIIDLNSDYYKKHFLGFGRVTDDKKIQSAKIGIKLNHKIQKEPDELPLTPADDALNEFAKSVYNSKANWVLRLLNGNKKVITNWENPEQISSHKLSVGESDGVIYVYPEILEIDGELYDFTDPKNNKTTTDALFNAIKNHDVVEAPNYDIAEWYTNDNYKKYFDSTKKYVELHKEGGTMEIVIEKKSQKENPVQCLLCTILNALGLGKEEFKLHEDPTSLLGGNMQIVIELGGPKKAYEEDSLEKMFLDIFPMIDTKEEYSESDVKKIRQEKAKYGESIKKLLGLMDDKKIVKAFNGMQMLKKGGSVKSAGLRPKSQVRESISGDIIQLPDNINDDQQKGREPIQTSKGTVYAQGDGHVIYAKNIDPRIKLNAEGGQVEEVSTVSVKIGKKTYNLFEAKTESEKEKGLMGVTKLKDDEGMIFYYDKPQEVSFWMKDTVIPLTICFFNEDQECISVQQGHPMSEEPMSEKDVMFVVELNSNSDIVPGDTLDFPGDDDEYVMQVLGSDGEILYQLKGGERIVSRRETIILLRKAKRAYESKKDDTYDAKCRSLGKYIFKVLDGLDDRDPEYVSLDSKNN